MITKIYFQITDSESINFDSDVNMSVEEYDALILDKFQQDQYMMKFIKNKCIILFHAHIHIRIKINGF